MKILRAEIQGFRSFSAAQSIDFSSMTPGLYQVTGQNLVEPELDANGAGKSSLFEAVYWALYGKTSRNLKAGTVKNWNSTEKCGVALDVSTAAGDFSILRMWSPNTLEVSGDQVGDRPVDQTELERLIGISPEAFLFSVYFAQFTPAFVDLSAAEQTVLFSSVLNLGLWERAADRASKKVSEIEGAVQQLKQSAARIQGQAEELLSQDYVTAEKAWENGYRADLREAEKKVASTKQALPAVTEQAARYHQVKAKAEEHGKLVDRLTADECRAEETVGRLSRKNITACPTCGQPVDSSHIKKELDKARAAHKEAAAKLAAAVEQHTALVAKLPKEDPALKKWQAEKEHQAAVTEYNVIKNQNNPYTPLRVEQGRRGEKLATELDTVETALHTEEKRGKSVQYWVKGFKEIRLSLIHESLAQLTVEVNETLFCLGLQDWSIEFDIERETKSGGINRSFTILIKAPHVSEPVPWGVWSGGESQRLRLAISTGFANLISNRTGIKPNVEFWDEPSQWLSSSGIENLLQVLADRAEQQQKIILLADHRVLDFGGFAGAVSVVKDKTGSRITHGITV